VNAFVARLVAVLVLAALPMSVAWGANGGETLYQVTNLDSLGGTPSEGNSINNLGWIAGPSELEGNAVRRATLWRDGEPQDLGTLGGLHSNVLFPVKNVRGLITGIAETAEPDPLNERWSCSRFFPSRTGKICRGFVWRNGKMRPLPTLGGSNGFATGSNNRRQVVGWAENTVRDPTCSQVDEQYLQFHAVIWGPGRRQIQDLPPLPGDSASAATAINDLGQVVGISGRCDRAFGRFSAVHSVLWEDGVPTNIGDLGGVAWNTPVAINRRGDIVGFSNTSPADGGSFRAQAFLKLAGQPIQNLGTISPDETLSQALGINEARQVVGISCTPGFASCRAFIWENGVMRDLNGLVDPAYSDHLVTANDINDLGQITGRAIEQGTGAEVPFVATPADGDPDDAGSAAAAPDLPQLVRQKLMARFGIHKADLDP
jgi:probable HAF family extracellular repeat protein